MKDIIMKSLRYLWHLTKCQNKTSAIHIKSIHPLDTIAIKSVCTRPATTTTTTINIRDTIKYWSYRFKNEGISEPVESIQNILAHVMGIEKRLELMNIQEKRISKEQTEKLNTLCLCRLSRMPVQYIIGEWTFRNIIIKLIPPIFIPRPETEMLVDFVAKEILLRHRTSNSPIHILEIGCGSGAISLAIIHLCHSETNIKCIAIDQNAQACELTKMNAKKMGIGDDHITIVNAKIEENGNIFTTSCDSKSINFSNEQFDIIVSNPPYIPTSRIKDLSPEIKIFEDIEALDGGRDGLKIIKFIIKYSSRGLKPYGRLFLEVDSIHPKLIQFFITEFAEMKLKYQRTYKDYYNNDRFVEICKIDQFLSNKKK